MQTDISARVRAKFPLDTAEGELWAWRVLCPGCGSVALVVTGIWVMVGPPTPSGMVLRSRFSLAELGEFGGLFESIMERIAPAVEKCRIARRFSPARGRYLLSNGCRRCGFLLGQYFDMDEVWDKRRIGAFAVPLDEHWRRAVVERGDLERARARAVPEPGMDW